jgi:TPP-dependent 2-oxoacid decarboxylase
MGTVGGYLATRLAQIGLKHHFVVPGDYNLVLLDQLLLNNDMQPVNCANELNCAFAAEGYARARGAAACVVTFSVGALSAFDDIGGAFAENLPVILISGSPNTNDARDGHLLHHTLGSHDFSYQLELAKRITCQAVAIQRAEEAPRVIDQAIRAALLAKKPAYIEIPSNLAGAACAPPGPISAVIDPEPSDAASLAAAVDLAPAFLATKRKPMLLAGHAALWTDLRRNRTDADLTDVKFLAAEADHALSHLRQWMKPPSASTPPVLGPALPAALGCRGWFTARVTTLGELDAALARAARGETASYIEVVGGKLDFPAGHGPAAPRPAVRE